MRIFGWCADRQGCGWYRIALPLHGLRAWGGHEVAASERIPRDLSGVDVVVGQRVCLPGPTSLWQRLCREKRVATVYEVDDDLLSVDPSSEIAHAFYSRPEIQANVVANAAAADLVTVSTEPLAEVMRRHNPRVVVLPNVVDGALLDVQRPHRKRLTVGWAGSATHRMDLAEAAGGLRQFLRRNPEVDLHVIGTDYSRMIAGSDRGLAERIRYTGWQPQIADYYRHLDFDIGLAPLRAHVFNRCKSPVKALEYAALGIPVVASDTGPYAGFVEHQVTGVLVRYPHEWATWLRTLAHDHAMREEMGAAAREQARGWTIQARWGAWQDTYSNLLGEQCVA